MYLPAFFLSEDIAKPMIFRLLILLKLLLFIPPRAIKFVMNLRVIKLNLVTPKNPFFNLYFVSKILDRKI